MWMIAPAPFGLLEFTGPERNDFLQRMLSNDMRLSPGQATSAYYLNVQGRPVAQFWVFQDLDSTYLICPRDLSASSLEELDRMHFGEKLRMADLSQEYTASLLLGPERHDWLQRYFGQVAPGPWAFQRLTTGLLCRFPWAASGSDLLLTRQPLDLEADLAPPERFLEERIRAGRAWPSDWGEKTLFLEVAEDHDYLDGKGCYPGQEVVARTLHRGHINRHLACLRCPDSTPQKDCRLLHNDKEVGWICASHQEAALAYLRREVWQPGTQLQRSDGGSATVVAPERNP